jgi:DNA-binding LytR/AlgR family response regulator|tara:strand:- start:248 stop:580 length:333 start_codon:yes stop_codon:yes gene_type:complete
MKMNLIVKTGRSLYHRIELSDLEFIQAHKGRTIVMCKQKLNTAAPFKDVISVLNGNIFKCHRSYAVNLDAVISFTNDSIRLPSKVLPLGSKYKEIFIQLMFEKNTLITSK